MTWNTDDMQHDFMRLYEAKAANAERASMGMMDETIEAPEYDPIDESGNDALTGEPVESSWLSGVQWARDDEQDIGFTGERVDVAGPAELRSLPPEHPAINAIGELMQNLKTLADKYEVKDWVPLLGGMGVGELLMGQGPEWMKDYAHGFGMQTVPIAGGVQIPDSRALDAGFMAADAGALAAGGAKLAKGVAGAALSGPPPGSMAAQEGSWLSFLSRSGRISRHMSKESVIEAAKSQGAKRVSEQTAENVLKAIDGKLEPVSIKVGPVTLTEGDGLSHGFYYMAANEDRVADVMRTLGLQPGNDPVKNFKTVLDQWNKMPFRVDGDRLIFGRVSAGQRATGMILDSEGNPTTAFTIIYGGKK